MEKHSDCSHCDLLAVTHTKLIHRQRSQRPISPTTTPPLNPSTRKQQIRAKQQYIKWRKPRQAKIVWAC